MATQPDLYVGKEPATYDFEGSPVFIGPTTVVRAGHPIMKGREALFEPLRVHYDVPQVAETPPASAEQSQPRADRAASPLATTGDATAELRQQATALGIRVDGRWSADRLRQEIERAQSAR